MSYTVAGTIENVSYVWTSRGEQTGTFNIDETEGDHKIVAYTKKDGIYVSAGAAVFSVGRAKKGDPGSRIITIDLAIPRDGMFSWGRPQPTGYKVKLAVALPFVLRDISEELESCAERLINKAPKGPRYAQYDFDFPFRMPGNYGMRYIVPAPFKPLADTTYDNLYPNSGEILGISATGWKNPYYHEKIDDIAPVWASKGTGKDCEDFSLTVACAAKTAHFVEKPYLAQGRARGVDHVWVVCKIKPSFVRIYGHWLTLESTHPILFARGDPGPYTITALYSEDSAHLVSGSYKDFLINKATLTNITGTRDADWQRLSDLTLPSPH